MNNAHSMRVVIDTNVLVAAARSKQGASYAIVSTIPSPEFQTCLSVGLYCEWLDVLSRPENQPPGISKAEVEGFIRYLAGHSHLQNIHFLWRPFLLDSDDDPVLELALAAGCEYIITHNESDFRGCEQLGVTAISPREFLRILKGFQ